LEVAAVWLSDAVSIFPTMGEKPFGIDQALMKRTSGRLSRSSAGFFTPDGNLYVGRFFKGSIPLRILPTSWFAAKHSAAAFKEKEGKRRHLTEVVAILLFARFSLINL
jgi:hypothetical protein